MQTNEYDAIVIGSGMGGLTTASLLAQVGKKRVLVLERHFKLGGFTHSFRRKKYEWDPGVHYVGQMQDGSMTRRLMDLVTGKLLKWRKTGNIYERFIFPEITFEVPDGEVQFKNKLIEYFPHEKVSIEAYFRDVRKAQGWVAKWFFSKLLPKWMGEFMLCSGRSLALQTTAQYLSRFQDERLRAILSAQWPDFGSPPSESAFGFHSTVTADYFDGAYVPSGGGKRIAESIQATIEENNGRCLVNHEIKEILVQEGKVAGVTAVHKGNEIKFLAPIVISNAGAYTTFNQLVSKTYCHNERRLLSAIKRGTSACIAFLGLNDDPRRHGFDDANYWIYSRYDHDASARKRDGEFDRIDGAFVAFASVKDPELKHHTAQIVTFSDAETWEHFKDGTWKNREAEYEAFKLQTTKNLIQYAESRLPGLSNLIEYSELSTPLTVKHFLGHAGGQIYGQPCDPGRLSDRQWRIETSLKGLYLTGSDVGTPGINGALMGGVFAAAKVMGVLGFARIMAKAYSSK